MMQVTPLLIIVVLPLRAGEAKRDDANSHHLLASSLEFHKPTVAWDRCWLFSMDRQTTNRLFGLGCDCGFTPRARLVGSSGRGVGQGADQMISGMVIKLNLIFVCMEWQTQSDSLYWQAYWI